MGDLGETMDRVAKLVDERMSEIKRLRAALTECLEYFENRADADHNGHNFVPNEEMKMAQMIEEAMR